MSKDVHFPLSCFFFVFFSWQQSDLHNLVNEVITVTQSSSDKILDRVFNEKSYLYMVIHLKLWRFGFWILVALVFNISILRTFENKSNQNPNHQLNESPFTLSSYHFIVGFSDFKMKYLMTISQWLIKYWSLDLRWIFNQNFNSFTRVQMPWGWEWEDNRGQQQSSTDLPGAEEDPAQHGLRG